MSVHRDGLVAKDPTATDDELCIGIAALDGAAGWSVRCTPSRRVVRVAAEGAMGMGRMFGKIRRGGWGMALREWRWLSGEGPPLPLPRPVGLFRRGGRSLVLMREVPGRPVQSLLPTAAPSEVRRFLVERAAPQVAALHRAGWVYRDLYWNHAYAAGLGEAPVWIDVERAFRPKLRRCRWVVKDLAGLVSSASPPLAEAHLCAALDAYRAAGGGAVPVARVLAKAARVRARQPRFGA